MASTSLSTTRSNQTRTITYDVFLSFRGEDTRYTFTDHLYKALVRAGLRTFRDNDEIERGQELKPEIENAIIESKASIVVLSPDYANSGWCLNELWLIMEQREEWGHLVVPIFYHIDPSHVKHQTESYDMKGSKGTEEDRNRWKAALTKVASLKGDVLQLSGKMYETDFIDQVVEAVNCQLDRKHVISTPSQLTGMETRIKEINSLLQSEQYNVIAICGMGGIGKTTLAQWIYNSNKHSFKSSSFVEKIGENYKQGLLRLQKKLLKDISGNKKIKISNEGEGTSKIQEVLQSRKVFIVLDDIDDKDQLDTLLGKKVFHAECKIIITTRLRKIDEWCKMHELNSLNDKESLQLFSWHAFPSKALMKDFKDIAKQLSQYCGGNPLALRVLGSSLHFSDGDKTEDIKEGWRDRMNLLSSSKGDLDSKIHEVLWKSFDSLSSKSVKDLFLHIACFFVGQYEEHVISILQDDLHARSGIKILINKCLLTVSRTGHLVMHQLLQEMGRKIVYEDNKDPAKGIRVSWDDDESYRVLEKGNGSDTVEALSLDIKKVTQKTTAIQTSLLANMHKLKLLWLKNVALIGPYENFPKLRYLCWHGSPLEKMHNGLLHGSLVAVDMSGGNIKTFEVPTVLNSLKILNLTECDKLASIYNLYRLPKLEELLLSHCSRLTHLCESVGDLESLALLDLKGCIRLLKASTNKTNVESRPKRRRIDEGNSRSPMFTLPCSLKFLYLNNCDIKYNNDALVAFQASSFFNLCLEGSQFKFLPNSFDLKMLQTLDLSSCSRLKSLPCIPSTLEELYVERCYSLENITFQSGRFSLKQFSYEDCSKLSEVQGLFKLLPIADIDEADILQHMQWIKEYDHHEVDLVGDVITTGRGQQIQMLYEYGIISTYLQGITDQISMKDEHTSSSKLVFFRVPSHHENNRIQGLHVSCIYRSSESKDKDMWQLLAKISNKTRGLTWVYNPVVYCNPDADEDVLWLSYWPIGSILDANDEVHVDIIVDEGVMVSECGVSLVYMDAGEVEKEEICENSTKKGEEVIGGDLSEFEVATKGYFLCRRDLFGLDTSYRLKELFGDDVDYPESQGWKKTRQTSTRSYIPAMMGQSITRSYTPDTMIYDVFVSFRGADTRNTFTDNLYHALVGAGIHSFRDDDDLSRGKDIKREIETAIVGSRTSIVILSENYANSRWCLDELYFILDQRRNSKHFVLPIFYYVDPSNVRKQTGSFSLHQYNGTENIVWKWKEALTEVANLTGIVVSGYICFHSLFMFIVQTIVII
ncbi:disease resistance protein RPV1-like [Bidens hawaiensis]|uniref:disease resistance protein RPV1-like n=1 Tax=Bidens hawaiensis TaxID=980011 RepID=UPI00404B9B73